MGGVRTKQQQQKPASHLHPVSHHHQQVHCEVVALELLEVLCSTIKHNSSGNERRARTGNTAARQQQERSCAVTSRPEPNQHTEITQKLPPTTPASRAHRTRCRQRVIVTGLHDGDAANGGQDAQPEDVVLRAIVSLVDGGGHLLLGRRFSSSRATQLMIDSCVCVVNACLRLFLRAGVVASVHTEEAVGAESGWGPRRSLVGVCGG